MAQPPKCLLDGDPDKPPFGDCAIGPLNPLYSLRLPGHRSITVTGHGLAPNSEQPMVSSLLPTPAATDGVHTAMTRTGTLEDGERNGWYLPPFSILHRITHITIIA